MKLRVEKRKMLAGKLIDLANLLIIGVALGQVAFKSFRIGWSIAYLLGAGVIYFISYYWVFPKEGGKENE